MDLTQIETELKKASDGLLMMSETDAPFEFFEADNFKGQELTDDIALKLSGMSPDYPMEKVELEYFFRNMTKARPETGELGIAQARRFEALQAKLKELLRDVNVYRIGTTQIVVLILGTTPEGIIAGLKTLVVET